jgi:hypothetical protein
VKHLFLGGAAHGTRHEVESHTYTVPVFTTKLLSISYTSTPRAVAATEGTVREVYLRTQVRVAGELLTVFVRSTDVALERTPKLLLDFLANAEIPPLRGDRARGSGEPRSERRTAGSVAEQET